MNENPVSFNLSESAEIGSTVIYLSGCYDYDREETFARISIAGKTQEKPLYYANNDLSLPPDEDAAMEVFEYAKQVALQEQDPDVVHMMVRKKIREVEKRLNEKVKKAQDASDQEYRESLDTSYAESKEINSVKIEVKWVTESGYREGGEYRIIFPQLGEDEGRYTREGWVNWLSCKEHNNIANNPDVAQEVFEFACRLAEDWGKKANAKDIFERIDDTLNGDMYPYKILLSQSYGDKETVNGIRISVGWNHDFDSYTIMLPDIKGEFSESPHISVGKDKAQAKRAFEIAKAKARLASGAEDLQKLLEDEFPQSE